MARALTEARTSNPHGTPTPNDARSVIEVGMCSLRRLVDERVDEDEFERYREEVDDLEDA